ncbi:MAG: Ig-like domain-containing protein [Rubrivivax sp.]|nr:Ig-like domain-containing protein [Rubrivivax sp.]
MNMLKTWIALLLVSLLAACGGGGGSAGTPVNGGSNPGTVTDLVIVLGSSSISNSGTETVTATVTAVDSNRNALPNIPVTVAVDNNGVITTTATNTNEQGQLVATVGIGSDRTSRTLNITARSGSVTKSIGLTVSEANATADASDLVLTLGAVSIANNGSQTVTATATALDAKRNVLAGVGIELTVDANATIAPNAKTTDSSGTVRGVIGIGSDRTNRTIKVTARSGALVRTANLPVTDGTGGTPVAADLSLTLSAPTLVNSGTAQIIATATAVDANRNAVSGIPVTIVVDSSALAVVGSPTTNTSGVVTANVGIGADRSNRVVTVTAISGALTRSASFRVIGADLTAAYSPQVDTSSGGNRIEFKLVDFNSIAMVDQAITVSAPGLPTVTGKTDVNGKFNYTYTAPSAAGALAFTAAAAGETEVVAVIVQAPGGGSVPAATERPLAASVSTTPSVVSVNTVGSTLNQSELRALFLGADNKPIKNIRVRFDLAGNLSNTDGEPTWLGGTFAYSDVSGVARGTFTAGQRSSPTNGVTIRACYDIVDFPSGTCPNAVTTTLTVASEALSVAIRTNEELRIGPTRLTYIKEFVVMVVDAAGQAKQDVVVTPSIDITAYYKGFYILTPERWVQQLTLAADENYRWDSTVRAWVKAGLTFGQCPNEDVNRNAVREAGTFVAGAAAPPVSGREEDLNWNGDLDPRKADIAIKMVGSNKTDANGLAVVQIEYGKDLGSWEDYLITVTAAGVSGSEARARYAGRLTVLASEVNNVNAAPAFVQSPYGTGALCTDTR